MNKKGFTLVEIMITVAIIGILAAILVPNIQIAKMTANEAAAQKNLKTFGLALEQYSMINSDYPNDLDLLVTATPPYLPENIFDGVPRDGYMYNIAGGAPSGGTYSLTASPAACGGTGRKIYYMVTGAQPSSADCT